MPKPNKRADVTVENHGSLFLVRPHTDAAEQWLKENVQAEPYMYHGKALAVEHRYISEIVRALKEEGFIVV